jgi:hypothetical protein
VDNRDASLSLSVLTPVERALLGGARSSNSTSGDLVACAKYLNHVPLHREYLDSSLY